MATPGTIAVPDPAGAPAALNRRLVIALAAGQFGTSINMVSLVLVSFPLAAAAVTPDSKTWTLGLLTGLHALVSMVVTPVFGVLSDRCWSRFGMRRPFILAGSLLAGASMLLMGTSATLPGLLFGDALHAAGTGIFVGGFAGIVPDQVPESYRSRAIGVISVMTILAGVVAALAMPTLMHQYFALFAVPGIISIVCSAAAVIALRDRILPATDPDTSPALSGLLKRFRISPRQVPDFSWAWTSHFCITLGGAFTTTYGIYFLTDQLQVPERDLPTLITATGVVGLVTAVVGAGTGAYLSDRFQIRKSVILLSALVSCAGAVTIAISPTVDVYMVGMVITGLSTGMLMPVQGALIIDVLPGQGHESGKYMALAGLADSIPRSVLN